MKPGCSVHDTAALNGFGQHPAEEPFPSDCIDLPVQPEHCHPLRVHYAAHSAATKIEVNLLVLQRCGPRTLRLLKTSSV